MKHPPRKALAGLGLAAAITLGLALEFGLRLLWRNPYIDVNHLPGNARLCPPNLTLHADAAGLYEGGGRVRLRTDDEFSLLGATGSETGCWALGGSTTQNGAIPEGRRWPDLVGWRNYGVAANKTLDSYYNLRFLLSHARQHPRCAVVCEAVNDFGVCLSRKPYGVDRWRNGEAPLALVIEGQTPLMGRWKVADSALASFVFFYDRELLDHQVLPWFRRVARRQDPLPTLDEAGLASAMADIRARCLPERRRA